MLSIKGLINFIDRRFLLKTLYLALLYSLVPFGEIALLLYLKTYFGSYLLLAVVLATGLLGICIAWRQIVLALQSMRHQVDEGRYPEDGFAELAGSLFTGLLLVTPGFVTDVLGLLLIVAIIRRGVGRLITSKLEVRLKELYEYMKL